ncbi:glycosyltransferase [Aliarcobacter butzleri]
MKIVYISNSIIPSRTANSIHVMKMCQAFADNGHEVILLAPEYNNLEQNISVFEYYGVKQNFEIKYIKFLNVNKIWSFSYALNTYKFIKNLDNIDIVYGRDLKSCFFATKTSKNIKVEYEPHKPYDKHNFVDKYFLKRIVKESNFKRLVVISEALKTLYKNNKYFRNTECYVAHDGADFPFNSDIIETIIDSKKLNIGYTGHLYQGRGIDIILKIAERYLDINFHIVGGNPMDIKYWKNKSSSKNVIYHGFVEPKSVYKYVNSFDILLAPYQNKVSIAGRDDSSKYMSPLKIFEYMASNKAIIVSDLDVLHEVLDSNQVEFVTYNNIDDWCNAIEKLKDKNYRNNLAINAYKNFVKNYTWKIRAENVIK